MVSGEEGLYLHPRHYIVGEIGTIEKRSSRREIIAVAVKCHEAEGAMAHGK